MSTGTTSEKTTRLAAAEKVRAVAWLATRPKPIEAESMAAAAKVVSDALTIKLTAAVLQDILDADPSLAAKVVIGGGGAVAHLSDVVEALSLRVDAMGKASTMESEEFQRELSDLSLAVKSIKAHQDAWENQVAQTLNEIGNVITAITKWAAAPGDTGGIDAVIGLVNGIQSRPLVRRPVAKGEDKLPGLEDSTDGSGSTTPS